MLRNVAQQLVDRLARGQFAIGDTLPTQSEWAKEFGVSSFTVSKAFSLLKERGVVSASQGSYTKLLKIPSRMLLHEAETPPVELEIWQGKASNPQKIVNILARQRFTTGFMRHHPQIRIRTRLVDNSNKNLETECIQSMLHSNKPALSNLEYTSLFALVEGDVIAPVNMTICGKSLNRVHREILEACTLHNQLFLFPTSQTNSLLCQWVESPTSGTATDLLDDLDSWCRDLTSRSKTAPALWVTSGYTLAYWLFHLIYACTPAQLRPTLARLNWQEDHVEQGLKYFTELVNEGAMVAAPEGPETQMRFLRGDIPYIFGSTDMLIQGALAQGTIDHLRLHSIPGDANDAPFSLRNIGGWVVNQSLSLVEKEAAWRYINAYSQWMRQPEPEGTLRRPPNLFRIRTRSGQADDQRELPTRIINDLHKIDERSSLEPVGTHWFCQSLTPVLAEALQRIPRPIQVRDLSDWLFMATKDLGYINASLLE